MSSATLAFDQDAWRPKYNPWLIAVLVAFAAFIEVLDTSIANVALPYMAGNLAASNDQSAWVLTSYLVSNAIILPISPTIGPALGGWITFNYSWRWIFFINIPVAMATWFLVRRFVEDPPYLGRPRRGGVKLDYIGIALLTFGIGALQILLDRGQEDDWLGSPFLTTLVVIAAVCLICLVVWEWFHKAPIIDVRMFKDFNSASANPMMFMLGIMLFSSLVLMPQFLQTLLGYTSQLAGLALSAGGLVSCSFWPLF